MCEEAFSCLTSIKNKDRNRLEDYSNFLFPLIIVNKNIMKNCYMDAGVP